MKVDFRRRATNLIAACLLLWPGNAWAEPPSSGMRAALAVLPQAAIAVEGPVPLQIEFGDPGAMGSVVALQALRGTLHMSPQAEALSRSLPGEMGLSPFLSDPEGFEAATGLRLEDLGQILTVNRAPERLTRLLVAPGAAARMVAALTASGHDVVDRPGDAFVLSRGVDFETDLTRRNPADPFGGPLGQATRFHVSEGVVLHAVATPILDAAMSGAGPMLADHPGLAALLDGLDAGATGAGELVHAIALLGLHGRDLLLADLAQGASETGVLVIAVPDTAVAERLAARLSESWLATVSPVTGAPYAALFDGPVQVAVHAGSPASVTLRRSQPRDFSEPLFRNRPADSIQRLLLMGDLPALLAP